MAFVREYVQRVAGHFCDREFQLGMLFVALMFLLCALALAIIRLRRRGRDAVVVHEAGGDLVISRRAFADFVASVVTEFPPFQLVEADFAPAAGESLRVALKLKADSTTDLTSQHNLLRERLKGELKARLGLGDKVSAIDMQIVSLDSPPSAAEEEAVPEA